MYRVPLVVVSSLPLQAVQGSSTALTLIPHSLPGTMLPKPQYRLPAWSKVESSYLSDITKGLCKLPLLVILIY